MYSGIKLESILAFRSDGDAMQYCSSTLEQFILSVRRVCYLVRRGETKEGPSLDLGSYTEMLSLHLQFLIQRNISGVVLHCRIRV
jgi:hypothetical protein